MAKAEFRKAKNSRRKEKAEEKVQFFIAELEKAKNIRDKIQDSFKIGGKKETKNSVASWKLILLKISRKLMVEKF